MPDEIMVRSLWTAIRTGEQLIVTGVDRGQHEWVHYLLVGKTGSGQCRADFLLDTHVLAGEGCEIQARAL